MRLRPLRFGLVACLASLGLGSCGEGPGSGPIALRDPLGLMDVTSELRLVIFESTERSCETDGALVPALPETPDVDLPAAVVDRRFPKEESEQPVVVEEGSYVIAVQGWGTDPVTMVRNTLVTRGCATSTLEAGQERPVMVQMQDIEGMGVCGDPFLSPDEQCEATTGPFPCDAATCRTTETVVNTTTTGTQDRPAIGWEGDRMVIGFQNGATELRWVFKNAEVGTITSPSALSVDAPIDDGATLAGVQTSPAVAVSNARIGAALHDLSTAVTEGGDVYARFFTRDRTAAAAPVQLVPSPGEQRNPRIAMTSDGAAMVVFSDTNSSSGATAIFIAAGATTPSSTFPLGTAGAATPDVTSNGTQFLVTWVEGGAVQAQRYGMDGAAVDATPVAVSESPSPGVPRAALLADGRAYIVWGSGSGVRGRALDPSGVPGEANDLTGSGSSAAVAGGSGRFLAVWDGGGTIQARYLDGNGRLADNHEQPRTTDPFPVGSGTRPAVAAGTVGSQAAAAVAFESGGNIAVRTLPLP